MFYLLEAAGFETWLVNAKDVKHLPGRPKTDLLTELLDVAATQEAQPSPQRIAICPEDPVRQALAGIPPA